jgi:putative membrane protein
MIQKGDVKMKTKLSSLSTLACLSVYPALAFAQQSTGPWDWPGPWHMWSGGWGFWWIFPMIMLFMIVACIAMFFFGHRSGGGLPHWGPGRSFGDPTYSALQILNERFAKGEIQKQEYEEKKTAIVSSGQH